LQVSELLSEQRAFADTSRRIYRVDDTYFKGEGTAAVFARSPSGQTHFLLTERRDAEAAKPHFRNIFAAEEDLRPPVVNVDKGPAYLAALEALNSDGTLPRGGSRPPVQIPEEHRRADHHGGEEGVWLDKGYGSFQSAWRLAHQPGRSDLWHRVVRACSELRNGIEPTSNSLPAQPHSN